MFGEDVIYCFLAAVKLQGDLWCFGALVLWCFGALVPAVVQCILQCPDSHRPAWG